MRLAATSEAETGEGNAEKREGGRFGDRKGIAVRVGDRDRTLPICRRPVVLGETGLLEGRPPSARGNLDAPEPNPLGETLRICHE
jgi:hypothetical protein